MAYTVPNLPSGASAMQIAQSEVYGVDIDILAAGNTNTGVVAGCATTATGATMVLTVASGTVRTGGSYVAVGTQSVTAVADGTNPRITMIVADSGGSIQMRAGTAAAAPVPPALTAGDVALAQVYVPAAATTLASANLIDKRVFLDTSPTLGTYNVFNYGATGNWRTVSDGVIATSGNHVTSATAAFTQADVGKYISISKARSGTGGAAVWLTTTIATVTGATTCTLATAPTLAVASAAHIDIATDDTAAIQAAIDAVPVTGGNVILPTGTYLITQTLKLGSGANLRGLSPTLTTIKAANGFNPTLPTVGASVWYGPSVIASKPNAGTTSNVGIYDLTIDHNLLLDQGAWRWFPVAGGGPSNLNTVAANLANAHAIDFRYSQSGLTISNVKVRNPARYSVHIQEGAAIRVANCDVLSGQNGSTGYTNSVDAGATTQTGVAVVQQDGIHLDNCSAFQILNNTVSTVGAGTNSGFQSGGDDCIACLNFAGLAHGTLNGLIEGNTLTSGDNGVGLYEQDGVTCQNITIANNTFVSSVYAAVQMNFFTTGTTPVPLKGITIIGNQIAAPFAFDDNTNGEMGVINIKANTTTTVDSVDGLTITGNTINGAGMAATQASGAIWHGIFASRCTHVVVTNNQLLNWTGNDGIDIGQQWRNYTIANNVIDTSAARSGACGFFANAMNTGDIANNEFIGQLSGAVGIAINGTDLQTPDKSSFYNVVTGNLVKSYALGLREQAQGATVAANAINNNLWMGNLTPGCTTAATIAATSLSTVYIETGTGQFKVSDPISGTNLDNNGIYYPAQGIGTAAFTQVASTTYYQYLGRAKKAYTQAIIRLNVTTAGVTLSFAEVGIFTGTITTPGTVPTLTKNATANATLTSIAKVNTTVTLSGITPGTDLWGAVGVGTQGTAAQYTSTVADAFSFGIAASNSQRPSTATTTTPTVTAAAMPAIVAQFS